MSSPTSNTAGSSDVGQLINAYQDAYNKKDLKALRKLFAADAIRNNSDGTIVSGIDNIIDYYRGTFDIYSDANLQLRGENTGAQADGNLVSSGTWRFRGKKADGSSVDLRGSFRNILKKTTNGLVIQSITVMPQL